MGSEMCIRDRTYIDDVLVHTFDQETQLNLLEQTLLRLRKYGLKMNVAKSFFGASEVNYLGYRIIYWRWLISGYRKIASC